MGTRSAAPPRPRRALRSTHERVNGRRHRRRRGQRHAARARRAEGVRRARRRHDPRRAPSTPCSACARRRARRDRRARRPRRRGASALASRVAAAASAHLDVVAGGDTRQESVARGPRGCSPHDDRHRARARRRPRAHPADRVRPGARRRARARTRRHPGARPSSTRSSGSTTASRVLEPSTARELAAVQTPQGFPRDVLDAAYARGRARVHRRRRAARGRGRPSPSTTVAGDAPAFKITTPSADLGRAAPAVAPRSRRCERSGASRAPRCRGSASASTCTPSATTRHPLWLAGLDWPGEPGLAGHTDGDAVDHAICDALLAAAGLGDIGTRFGTDDPRFAGAHGEVFLARDARARSARRGARVGNVSVQVIGNRPKLAPRRAEAEALLTGSSARRSASPRPRPTGSASPAAARGSRRSPPRCSSPPDAAAASHDRVTARGAPVGLAGDRAALRHAGPGPARLRAARPGQASACTSADRRCSRARTSATCAARSPRHPAPLARAPRVRRDVRAQRHRHRRQGARQRDRRREPWWALAYRDRARVHARRTPRSASCRPTYEPRATASDPADAGAHRAAHRARARVRGRRRLGRRLLRRRDLAVVRRAHPPVARRHGGRGRRRPARQARPARLRPLEGRASRRARVGVLGVAVGRRAPGLAHRVLGDVAPLPRRRSSTSTAADSTCASRTTRTSSPSRRRRATRSPATGCTTAS